jgi:hypothetical protein
MTNSAPLTPDWNYIFGPKDESAAGQQLDFLRNVADRKAGGCFSVDDYRNGNAKDYLDKFEKAADPLIKSNFVLDKPAASFALYGAAGNGVSYTAVQDISTFLNSIPNTALSSLTPYVEVEFEFEYRANEVGPGKSRHPSLMRFLMGPLRNDTGNADALLDDSRILSVNNNKGNYQLAYSGMEMFTSPMTLVNPNIPNRYVPVLNPYAPLASLTALSVKVQSMKSGKAGFSSASMEVTLHDKTRLLEISELVQPQYFGGVVAWITYGWRCPTAQFKDNPFAKFVNSRMLTKQAFSITNSSFSFDVHSAKIQLTLATTGYREIKNFQLSSIETDIYVVSLGNQTQGLNSFYTNAQGNIVGKPTTVKDLNGEMQKVYNELRGTFNEKQASIFGNFMTISGDDNSVIPSTEAIETAQKNIASINGALTNRNDIPADIKQKMQKYVELMKVKYKSDKDGTYAFKDAVDTTASANIFKTFKKIFGNIKIDKGTNANASDDAPDDNWLPKKWKDFNDLVKKSAIAGTQLHLDSSRQQAAPKKAADDALADLKKAIADDKDVAIPEKKKKSELLVHRHTPHHIQ